MTGFMGASLLNKPFTACQHIRPSRGSNLITCMGKKHTYNIEVSVPEGESPEIAFRQFRRQVMQANIVNEVRRRQRFETPQDIIKRKKKEAGLRRARAKMFRLVTYDDVVGGTEAAPFADMFGDPDDIFAEDGGILLDPK